MELKFEKQQEGNREIDIIDQEIRIIQEHINLKKRQHLNWFYYF
jgi:hypothetical protein